MTATFDPVAAAGEWLAPVRLDATPVLFVIGFGEGHVLDALDRKGWSGHVVALEPEASAAPECLNRKSVRAWQKTGRLTILAGPDYAGLDKVLAALPLTTEKPVIAGNPEVTRAHRDQSMQAARAISRGWFGARANDEAKRQNAGRYLQNTLRNAGEIAREGDAAALKGLCAGLPALVVGAGPSLDRNLADIARFRDRVVILAADTALRPLLATGIEPDLVVATDPTETNARHLCELMACSRTHLVAEGSVDSESLREFEGRTFFFRVSDHHPWPWLRSAGLGRGTLRAWGSVLTTAFDLALVMGCEPIVFAGADLAFTDSRPYARGTTFEEVWHRAGMWGQPIEDCWSAGIAAWPETFEPGVHGETVRTAPHLRSFRDWIASEAGKATGRTIINGTGGGILVGPAIAQQPLADVLSKFPVLSCGMTDRILKARRVSGAERPLTIGEPGESTLAAWQAFSGSPVERAPETAVEAETQTAEIILDCLPGVDLVAAIENAWSEMSPADQRLILRDRTDSVAGVSVRRALFTFLERHPEVRARYGRFFDPNDDRSWIDRRPSSELFPGEDRDKWLDHHAEVANRLTPLIVEHFAPTSVLDVGCGAGHWLTALAANGVTDVAGVESNLAQFTPSRVFDLCFCLGVVQSLPMDKAEAVIASCTKSTDTVLFAVPAAAIGAPGFISERPGAVWAEVFARYGFVMHDELRPVIEGRWGRYLTSYDLVTVYRRVAPRGQQLSAAMQASAVASARRIDDLTLHYLSCQRAFEATKPAQTDGPRITLAQLTIPPARMEADSATCARRFRLRTTAGALALSAGIESLAVAEDGQPTTFAVQEDAITFRSSDGSDPRHNGRHYALTVPAYVAWLEQQPAATIMEHQL